ncbi:MAG: LysR family transcriptional regulator [Planctomycetota bacterium]|nr:LysR family transcriptional regulator [Planctomycetota bacterium]
MPFFVDTLQLKSFVAIAETGTFGQAATTVNRTQSALSRVRPVDRIFSAAGFPPMMERSMFPSGRSDHGKGPASGGGVGGADRPVAAKRAQPAGVLSAAWAQQRLDAKLGLQA